MKRIEAASRFVTPHLWRTGQSPERFRSRRGAFLIIAMVCLVLTMLLVGAVLKLVQTQRRQMLQERVRLQAEWLAESGCDRAAAQLRANPDYAGETWSISSADLGGPDSGGVIIHVEPVNNQPKSRLIRVEAIFPADFQPSVKRTRQATIVLFQES